MTVSETPRYGNAFDTYVRASTPWMNRLAGVFLIDVVLTFSVHNWGSTTQLVLDGIASLVWVAFTVDYLARLWLANDRKRFIRSHKLDLVMVLVPMLRTLRLAMLLRRSLEAMRNEELAGSFAWLVVFVISLGAVLVLSAESGDPDANIKTFWDALWWATVTTTTVGYGDFYPVTPLGRILAVFVMLVGIGLIGTVSASAATWFINRRAKRLASDETAAIEARSNAQTSPDADIAVEPTLSDILRALDDIRAEQQRLRSLLEPPLPHSN